LFFVPGAVLYGWSRRAVLAAAAPVMTYAAWYVLIGRGAMVAHAGPTLNGVLEWVPGGFGAVTAAMTGLGPFGIVVLLAALPLLYRAPERRLAIVGIIGLLTEYMILGLTRPGLNLPSGHQYLYFGETFLALVFVSVWPVIPRRLWPVAIMLTVLAFVANWIALVSWSWIMPGYMAFYDPFCSLCHGP
jgi:hypothetical protein